MSTVEAHQFESEGTSLQIRISELFELVKEKNQNKWLKNFGNRSIYSEKFEKFDRTHKKTLKRSEKQKKMLAADGDLTRAT